mmetsp:Transcript_117867/g.203662  ORF Transcript_117867/g.203662 Transcript_117867/m.203662 type:complete len:263 (+) Transcript_117867:214-1002(+)
MHQLLAPRTSHCAGQCSNHMVIGLQTGFHGRSEAKLCALALPWPGTCVANQLGVKEELILSDATLIHFLCNPLDFYPIATVRVWAGKGCISNDVWPDAIGLHAAKNSHSTFSITHLAASINHAAVDNNVCGHPGFFRLSEPQFSQADIASLGAGIDHSTEAVRVGLDIAFDHAVVPVLSSSWIDGLGTCIYHCTETDHVGLHLQCDHCFQPFLSPWHIARLCTCINDCCECCDRGLQAARLHLLDPGLCPFGIASNTACVNH